MSEKVGRTFFDFVAENKILALLLVTLLAIAAYKGYKVTFPGGFSVTPPEIKTDTIEIPVKSEWQNPSGKSQRKQTPESKIDLFPISGKIEEENGTGIGSVQVKSGSIKVRSDAQGRFEINLPFKSMTDELILTFEKEGFETYSQSFNRSQSQLTVPIKLKKKN